MIHAIDVALSQLGIAEATGKNDGIPAERYMRGDELAWCAGFALWCNANSDDENVASSTKEHYEMRLVKRFVEVAKRKGIFVPAHQPPQRNDFAFFGNTASDVGVVGSHMGIVESVDLVARTVTTIEGNYANKVSRVTRSLDDKIIIGWGRPSLLVAA